MSNTTIVPEPNDEPSAAELVRRLLARTPARLLVGRAGPAYRTATWLALRADHAAARDAVQAEVDFDRDLASLTERFGLFEVQSEAASKADYLAKPELGRRLSDSGRDLIRRECPREMDLQVVIGDGLSAEAVTVQVPAILPALATEAEAHGWRFGRPFFVRHCRVGIMNDVGEALDPAVVVLLIGERPGLAAADSLSAYLAFRPRFDHTDARRNLVSNIHTRGVTPAEAASRVAALAATMMLKQASGVSLKEETIPAKPPQLME